MSKTFRELSIGDYIFKCSNNYHDFAVPKLIIDICEIETDKTVFELADFGGYLGTERITSSFTVKNTDLDNDKIYNRLSVSNDEWFQTSYKLKDTQGYGKYIYNKAKDLNHREYVVIQDNALMKMKSELAFTWNKPSDLIIYKAMYPDCPDGPYFIRYKEDFYSNFTKIM